jgi:hypothetical protein
MKERLKHADPHQCERCGRNLTEEEQGRAPNPQLRPKWLLLCDGCESRLLDELLPPKPPPALLRLRIRKLVVSPHDILRAGDVVTVELVTETAGWLKVRLDSGRGNIKTLFADEFERVSRSKGIK